MITTIFFDLDDTLYDKSSYLLSAYSEIARYIKTIYDIEEVDVIEKIWIIYQNKGSMYGNLFDELIDILKIKDKTIINELVEIFHQAPTNSLELFEDASVFLEKYLREYYFGLITNGHSLMQRRKVKALGLNDIMRIQIYTDEIGYPKPSPKPYEYALKSSKKRENESIYIGDNPIVDFQGAKEVGLKTVRLLRGEFENVEDDNVLIDERIKDFNDLQDIIDKLNSN